MNDCDHKGCRKIRDESRNPDPELVAETLVCVRCGQVCSILLRQMFATAAHGLQVRPQRAEADNFLQLPLF